MWSLKPNESFKQIATLEGHAGPVSCVGWNPLYNQLASACTNLVLWQPKNKTMDVLNF